MLKLTHFQKFSIFLAIFFIFIQPCFAEIFVSISPKDFEGGVRPLYLDETAFFSVTAFNDSIDQTQNLNLKIVCDKSLSFIDDGSETKVIVKDFGILEPMEKKVFFVKTKLVEAGAENYNLAVQYGFDELNNLSATRVSFAESPLEINASLLNESIYFSQKNSFKFSLKNFSEQIIPLAVVFVQKTPLVEPMNVPVSFHGLSSGEETEKMKLDFLSNSLSGEQHAILVLEFADASGQHVIEKDFTFQIAEENQGLIIISGAVLFLVVVSILLMRKSGKSKSEEKSLPDEGTGQESQE